MTFSSCTPLSWIWAQTWLAWARASPILSASAGVAMPTPMPTAQSARTETWRPHRRARSRARALPRAANIPATLAIQHRCSNAIALRERGYEIALRSRSGASPSQENPLAHPLRPPGDALGGDGMHGHRAARERPRESSLEGAAGSLRQHRAGRAANGKEPARDRQLRLGRRGEERRRKPARAASARRARDDAEHALGGDRAFARHARDDAGALVAERRGIAEGKVDLAPAEERSQLRRARVEMQQPARRRDHLACRAELVARQRERVVDAEVESGHGELERRVRQRGAHRPLT